MSAPTLTKPSVRGLPSRGSAPKGGLGAPALPQVNLLPPEVRAARSLGVVKRWMAIAVAMSLVASAAGFGYALLDHATAVRELEAAEAETQRLKAQEQSFAEVPLVIGALDDAVTAQDFGMANDVQWQPFVDALGAAAPRGVNIEAVQITARPPLVHLEAPANPLVDPLSRVADVTVVGRAEVMADTAEWLAAFRDLPGVYDVYLTSAPATEDSGIYYYEFATSAQVGFEALSHRFDAPEDDAAEAVAPEGDK